MRIDCGAGYIFNPETGNCVKADGDAAARLQEKGRVSRFGTCNGAVKISKGGRPHCVRGTQPKKKKSPAGQGAAQKKAAGVAAVQHEAVARRRAHQDLANSLRLKLVESQMRRQMNKTNVVLKSITNLRREIGQLEQRLAFGAAQVRQFPVAQVQAPNPLKRPPTQPARK